MIKRVLINIACNSAALKKANLVKNQQSLGKIGKNSPKFSKKSQDVTRCYQILGNIASVWREKIPNLPVLTSNLTALDGRLRY